MDNDLFLVDPEVKYIKLKDCSSIYRKLLEKVYSVYQLFIDFYGEENVDLQGVTKEEDYINSLKNNHRRPVTGDDIEYVTNTLDTHLSLIFYGENHCAQIYIHWKECTIENEDHHKHLIKDLFAKINVTNEGKLFGSFDLTRTTYTYAEWKSDYAHSHICGIPMKHSGYDFFLPPCLGSGPIRNTISSLCISCDVDFWRLFCLELDLYVKTESLRGGPYRHIYKIGREAYDVGVNSYSSIDNIPYLRQGEDTMQTLDEEENLTRFAVYLFKHNASYIKAAAYSDKDGFYLNFCPNTDILKMSNDFLKFAKENNISSSKYVSDGVFSSRGSGIVDYRDEEETSPEEVAGKRILVFKNNPVLLQIDKEGESIKTFKYLKFKYIIYVLFVINNVYNCNLTFQNYGRKESVIGKNRYRFI